MLSEEERQYLKIWDEISKHHAAWHANKISGSRCVDITYRLLKVAGVILNLRGRFRISLVAVPPEVVIEPLNGAGERMLQRYATAFTTRELSI